MKWPLAAAHTRAGIADALATITPALITPGRGGPPAAVLRAALYRQAFNPARAGADPGPAAAAALAWAQRHSLPLAALADPQVTRRALDALTLRLDGTRAAAAPSPASGLSSATAWGMRRNSDCCRPTLWTASPGGPRRHPARWTLGQPPARLRCGRSWPRSPGSARS
jgi:hypothetical protein